MTRETYIQVLEEKLKLYNYPNADALVAEYNRFYLMREKNGESPEDIYNRLGPPEKVAFSYIMEGEKKEELSNQDGVEKEYRGYSSTKSSLLIVFNSLIMFVPYIALWIFIGALYLLSVSLIFASISAVGVLFFNTLIFYEKLALIGFSMTLFSAGALMFILMNSITRAILKVTEKYIKLNKHIAKR